MSKTLLIYKDKIVKQVSEEDGSYLGWDICTEKLVKIPIQGTVELPEVVVRLLKDKRLRFKLAHNITTKNKQMCEILNVTERTLITMKQNYE